MASKRPLAGPFSLALGRDIGRRDLAAAVRRLEAYLLEHPADVSGWTMLAQCHVWANAKGSAEQAAVAALKLDPNDFETLRLLSAMYAEDNRHAEAAAIVRRGLESFPAPSPSLSPWVPRVFRLVAPLLSKRLRKSIEAELPDLQDADVAARHWYAWAKDYLRWYDAATGSNSAPVLH